MVENNLNPIIKIDNLSAYFSGHKVLKDINLEVESKEILGIIGPSNSGKTTFLRAINKLNLLQKRYHQDGTIYFNGQDIKKIKDGFLRKKIGIIFALPQVLPVSIFDNVAYGPKVHGIKNRSSLEAIVEKTLRQASLWEEVKDRLNSLAMKLSGGQQQRLCIAQTLAVEPEVILYDEPCSGLDPISTAKIEETMRELKKNYTQILVTNNTKQAARVTGRCAFFLMGELIELNQTPILFTAPKNQHTDDYISGKFG